MRLSLNIGINEYNPAYYGSGNDLYQCVYDAQRFAEYAAYQGFDTVFKKDRLATTGAFKRLMAAYANAMRRGDILLITISGHGTMKDVLFGNDPNPKRLTAHCFSDEILWDYEFLQILKKFKAGVTVIKVSDCCYAESNWQYIRTDAPTNKARPKFVTFPQAAAEPTATEGDLSDLKCNYIHLASSNAFQVSYEDANGGVFTTALLKALQAEPEISYRDLLHSASEHIAPLYPQSPVFEHVRADKLTGLRFLTV